MMSVKERDRLGILRQVSSGTLPLSGAAAALGLSYRQVRRVYQRWPEEGDAGLVHRLRGRGSNRGLGGGSPSGGGTVPGALQRLRLRAGVRTSVGSSRA
ncbi:MAG: helix-turn-helix domain-containing protein [Phycisphaeraceae bacterium]|nr:helix-turn-helix domain-containing protein [Phycisphaeraceae bacterium]